MNKISNLLIIFVVILTLVMPAGFVDAYVSVKGYYRSDGTYVRPHVRSEPNGVKYDNYGYKPSQGLYNKTYGTRGSTWDTPTYITDPDYYEGKAIYESGSSGSSYSTSYSVYPKKGVTSSGVRDIQQKLAKDRSLYPEGIVSGYYGSLTEKAVQRFQLKYGIVSYGTPATTGYGQVGPRTQAKINEVFSKTTINKPVVKTVTAPAPVVETKKVTPKVGVPKNATKSTYSDSWYCDSGYKTKYDGVTKVGCTKIKIPSNASLGYSGSDWYCDSGYKTKYDGVTKVGCTRE